MQRHHVDYAMRGMAYAFVAICCFSLTLPMTKIAIESFSPYFVSVGRVAGAGMIAAMILLLRRQPWPPRDVWWRIAVTAAGIAIGFPFFTSMALTSTQASHAGIVLATLPLLTAIFGAKLQHESLSKGFWLVAISGCVCVMVYVMWVGGIRLEAADAWLFAASFSAAIGYAMGAKLTSTFGGLVTVCWTLVCVLPLSVPASFFLLMYHETLGNVSPSALYAMGYVTLVSQLLAFIPWYIGLSLGGIARVSQVQLLQVFVTLLAAHLTLGEPIGSMQIVFACIIITHVFIAKKIR